MAEFRRFRTVFASRLLPRDGLWRPIGPKSPKRLYSAFRATKPWVRKETFQPRFCFNSRQCPLSLSNQTEINRSLRVSNGFTKVRMGKKAQAAKTDAGEVGYVRALEVTVGENGWHPICTSSIS